ncbi:MAG: helix-turn-helix transcriptional regulator [Oscillospiraceae bacterium]
MGVSYKRLWKLLIDHNMKKIDLKNATGISPATMSKLNRDESVSLEVLIKICVALQCDIGDIVEMICDK